MDSMMTFNSSDMGGMGIGGPQQPSACAMGVNGVLDIFRRGIPVGQNKYYPLLTTISTITLLVLGILAYHAQISITTLAITGMTFSVLHLVNSFLNPKFRDPYDRLTRLEENQLYNPTRMTAAELRAFMSGEQMDNAVSQEKRQMEIALDMGIMQSGLLPLMANEDKIPLIKKVYCVGAFIIMTILYCLAMTNHISLRDMGILSITSSTLTLFTVLSLRNYRDRMDFSVLYADKGANLWKPWNYLCSQTAESGEGEQPPEEHEVAR